MANPQSSKSKTLKNVMEILRQLYPRPKMKLKYTNGFELLIAVILSAQCTDERVNQVTPKLFEIYPDCISLSRAKLDGVEKIIYPTGFYRNKAKNIKALAQILKQKYHCGIPKELPQLVQLPGVARKTANVVQSELFHRTDGIVVDTHVLRVSRRLGLTAHQTPQQVELDLMNIIPKSNWGIFPRWLIYHGRRICNARKPKCMECGLVQLCPSVYSQ